MPDYLHQQFLSLAGTSEICRFFFFFFFFFLYVACNILTERKDLPNFNGLLFYVYFAGVQCQIQSSKKSKTAVGEKLLFSMPWSTLSSWTKQWERALLRYRWKAKQPWRDSVSGVSVRISRVALVSACAVAALLKQALNRILEDKCLAVGWLSTVICCFTWHWARPIRPVVSPPPPVEASSVESEEPFCWAGLSGSIY